jgi:ADP-ribosylglycohydrolase
LNYQRSKNALLGLAIGDSFSWQAMYHRSLELPFWTRRIRREIDVESETYKIVKLNSPFSLNNPVEPFKFSPTDDTEWAAFTIDLLLKAEGKYDINSHIEAWKKLANNQENIYGNVSTKAALKNLSKGLLPPECGHDNPHYFDDGAMVRAISIGALYAGNLNQAIEYSGLDASITNSLDGVWASQAIAAAVSLACTESDIQKIVDIPLQQIPENSWLILKVKEALEIANKYDSLLEALPVLHDNIIDHSYNYGSAAPDNLALALAIFSLSKGDLTLGITSAASLAKTADSVPAFVGALCGSLKADNFSNNWTKKFTSLKGICIPDLKGKNFLEMTEKLNELAFHSLK